VDGWPDCELITWICIQDADERQQS
jgi:hypothetical protein